MECWSQVAEKVQEIYVHSVKAKVFQLWTYHMWYVIILFPHNAELYVAHILGYTFKGC